MKDRKHIFIVAMTLLSCSLLAMASTGLLDFHHSPLSYLFNPPPTTRKPNSSSNSSADTAKQKKVVMPDVVIDEEEIPDSLLYAPSLGRTMTFRRALTTCNVRRT